MAGMAMPSQRGTFSGDVAGTDDAFWARVEVRTPDECWPWLGAPNTKGYGVVRRKGRLLLAHRYAFELAIGPIPERLLVLHECDNPPCCNPFDLFAGTAQQNSDDMKAKGRSARRDRPWCGHIYDMVDTAGNRRCRSCYLDRLRRWREANR